MLTSCSFSFGFLGYSHHWRKLVKNIGWKNKNIGGEMGVKSDKCMGISQLLGGTSMPMTLSVYNCLV